MNELWIVFGVFVFWIVLNRWILPWLGIPTCMSGGCATGRCAASGPGRWSPAEQEAAETDGNQQRPSDAVAGE
jgi:hypothetical protein